MLDGFLKNLLKVDRCILAEDDDYIVFSKRMKKTELRANGAFLAALADHADAPRHWAPALVERRKTLVFTTFAAGFVLVFVLGDILNVSAAVADLAEALWVY